MKKLALGVLIILVGMVACVSDLEMGLSKWKAKDFKEAKYWLDKVEAGHKDYDSAQSVLKQLSDTAFTYFINEVKENQRKNEFRAALISCETALSFKPDTATVERLRKAIRVSATDFWIAEAKTRLKEEDITSAYQACDSALSFNPESSAAKKLRKEIEKAEARKRAEELLAARIQFAKDYEYSLLDEGIDATVTLHGTNSTTLKLKWIFISKVAAHELGKNTELFQNLRELGFKKFIITDGYYETWYWNLD